ncbi:MAG: slipin family protein [Erysipelotrichaceae bacterium]|jgi:regulator of protease activity HflC (stomatin/prohibitin superfamily)|nr:slipin family protein [Erysipelotrichaceae bacterium]
MNMMIKENERGLLFENGIFREYMKPGKHFRFGMKFELMKVSVNAEFKPEGYPLEVFLKNASLMAELEVVEVADQMLAIHFVDGNFVNVLMNGKHAFFKFAKNHTFLVVDQKNVEVSEDFPRYLFDRMPRALFTRIEVASFQKGLLYFDGKLERLLEPGTYYFWNNGVKVTAEFTDIRALQMDINGQEILTLDKIGVRFNFVTTYKITDVVKIHTEVQDYEKQIYIHLQLALREYVGKYRLDEILENKEDLSQAMFEKLKQKEEQLHVTFLDAGVKDIILPGEIRDIMNTVLLAEKKAQANVITRREEIASTRSLLNTARLMEENKTLYKLKELEVLEKICDNVGTISIHGGGDLLSQLTNVLQGEK